ncbi:MAG TPA: ABC transporter ATP-binding protein [Longimicrobiales bacterium]|nr:ABC transporter ATP-binding protein [Longimicrobiales bacterium]
MSVGRPLVEVRGIRYGYPGGAAALQGVSLQVSAGERLAVLGPNGAGKSTLLLHLNGLLLPAQGSVLVDGIVVSEATARETRRRVGFVFQNPDDQLFLPTLLEDVAFAPLNDGQPGPAAEARARATLRELGIEHAADRAAHHLSGGERRLAALATVLVSRPDVLVLDEPTDALDARGRRRVVDLLRGRPETLVVATHDLAAAAALCERAVVLDEGVVVWDAPLDRLLAAHPFLERHGLMAPLPDQPSGAPKRQA